MARVTVSYRRDDSPAAARAIYERLRSRYGADAVYMDVDDLELGEDYRKRISQAISQTDCLLVLIGPRWLGPTENGRNRIDDPNDSIRLEVERALETGLRVVPIVLEGTQMPSAESLPKSLVDLTFLKAGDISTGPKFDEQMERVTQVVDRMFAVAPAPSSPKPSSPRRSSPFPMRIVAIGAAAALVVLAVVGSSWAFLHRPAPRTVASTYTFATKTVKPSSTSGAPGALAISYVAGDVAVVRGDHGSPVAAVRNAPLLPGDALVTGKNSYAELHLGRGTRLFLDGSTQVRVVRAGDVGSEVQLAQGTAEMHVFRASNAQVDTQLAALVGNTPGVYAVSVVGDPVVTITALSGQATLETQSGEQTISAVRTVEFSGTNAAASVMSEQHSAIALTTGFSSFTTTRNSAIAPEFNDVAAAPMQQDPQAPPPDPGAAPAPAAVEQIDGTEDLATYGSWQNSDYGQAWVPDEPPQWTPYSSGQWVWEPYYGYTWVGNEPWAWAPYHYGTWNFQPGVGWMWIPGAAGPWAPAQVAFVPLGPGDPLAPWWGPSRTVVYATNVYRYRNWRAPHAIAQVRVEQFHQGNFHHVVHLSYANIHHPTVVNVMRIVPPTRANLAFTARPVHTVATFPRQAPFVGHPVAVQRSPFVPAPHVANSAYRPVQSHSVTVFGPQPHMAHAPVHSAYGPTASHVTSQYGPSRQTSTATYSASGHSFGPTQTYRPPVQAQTYTRPVQAQTQYQRPAQTQTQYQRPTQTQTQYQRPAQTQTYTRPVQPQPQYQRPVQQAPVQTYTRPTQTYERPAPTYQRPTPSPTVRPRY